MVHAIWSEAEETVDMVVVGFSSLAQSCRTYQEYIDRMAATPTSQLEFVGVGLFGPKRAINRLTGSLPLLR